MKVKVKFIKEVELDKIIVKAGARYWCDCTYSEDNGETWVEAEDDDDATNEEMKKHIPFIVRENIGYSEDGDYWNLTIDINSGKVKNWKPGFCIKTHFKVCDDGLYQVFDTEGNLIWDSMRDRYYYVPDFLSIGDEGYGDYMYLDIDGEGNIKDWLTEGIYSLRRLVEYSEEDD